MRLKRVCKNIVTHWRILFVILFMAIMIFFIRTMYSEKLEIVNHGVVDLTRVDFTPAETVALDGYWEFYWNRLLLPKDFNVENKPLFDSLIKVPGSWNDKEPGTKIYSNHGVATYRIRIKYPESLKDPALRIKTISAAYKLYANGKFILEVGKVSDKRSEFIGDYKQKIVDLPNSTRELDLIFQVANLDYIRGGLWDSLVFGSKQVIIQQKMFLLAIQLLFTGSVLGFGIFYTVFFIMNKSNKAALVFGLICFTTAIRALVCGETPITLFAPNLPIKTGLLINYITQYNLVSLIIIFIVYIYRKEINKKILSLILLPTLFFYVLLFTPPGFRATFNKYFYIFTLIQMIYMFYVLIIGVLRKRENSILLIKVMGIFCLTIVSDGINYKGHGSINLSHMFLYGNYAVIIFMFYILAKQQADTHKKLVLCYEKLAQADKLKDKIMETEMSFLQAQIKPHFLYNALNAIANVCETDGRKGSKLILDLAIYLRGSLEFNNLGEMVTIEKELECIDTYFNIEQARFGRKIQLQKKIEIPLDYKIPVLVLQPLVENAVRHGISKKVGGGTVCIRIWKIKKSIYVRIDDDGVGMDDEKLEILLNETRNDHGVGLINIHNRLLRLYGRGLAISSTVGYGTCVKIVIPEERQLL